MKMLEGLRSELAEKPTGGFIMRDHYRAKGYYAHMDEPNVIARAYAFQTLLQRMDKYLYPSDMVAGSVRGLLGEGITNEENTRAVISSVCFGQRSFLSNFDHFAPDYRHILNVGISGIINEIKESLSLHKETAETDFLKAAEISMRAFSEYITDYAKSAELAGKMDIAKTCRAVAYDRPSSFREALQLVWLCHTVFYIEGRYAMALGRMDQYLYPFYKNDIESGKITHDEALELLSCALYKIREAWYFGGDNVVNIVIAGIRRDGSDAVNDVTYLILDAVKNCNIPGPNLSARIHKGTPDEFLDRALQVIGTGLGYPALMNDEVNIPALINLGYDKEDCYDYCMVGCLENFMCGKQPPWSDSRYNSPKYLELAINNGRDMLSGSQQGPETGLPQELDTMDSFIEALKTQMRYGASEYMMKFHGLNEQCNPASYQQPFLSCFCFDCIGKAKDINNGGSHYPSIHGAGCMGIANVADSLAAIEKLVYNEKKFTLEQLRDMLLCDFKGCETERRMLLSAPKYGNDIDFVDKYAEWFVEFHHEIFSKYRTHDGGHILIAIASNVSNIPAGKEVAATPDGRHATEPLSDAASPMHGMDKEGPTAVANSIAKPDYTKVACGTVLNQKYNGDIFSTKEKRDKLAALIRTYFAKGGQEIQINSVPRELLIDAMDNPENYGNLVVRVSGFSAYYTLLNREVQEDILKRTEHK